MGCDSIAFSSSIISMATMFDGAHLFEPPCWYLGHVAHQPARRLRRRSGLPARSPKVVRHLEMFTAEASEREFSSFGLGVGYHAKYVRPISLDHLAVSAESGHSCTSEPTSS